MKRYSDKEAQIIIDKLKKKSFSALHLLFKIEDVPLFEELEGETAGSFLAWNPKNPFWIKFFMKILFNSPFARWTGKKFITPFDKENRGKGVNLFRNRILPHRFRFDTYIKKAQIDHNVCLALDYRDYRSLMFGLVDDVRKIEDGVFLGQMYYKFPWKKELWFLGYFVLCALKKS
ncbi:hypothetical protein H8E77_42130 [bacterium]|nr:hypothetical protein [bacterium]